MAEVNQAEEDKLSSLPDSILTEILSHLPINSAALTTVLSHRWRHLWTGVTRLNLSVDGSHFADIVDKIFGQLTSPKLTKFELNLSSPTELPDEVNNLESLFIDVYRRNVEYVHIDVQCCFYEELFWVPVCLFNSQFLVVLELSGNMKFDLPESRDYVVELPNLKRLKLDCLVDVPLLLGNLIRNCPLLEDLELGFQLEVVDSQIEGSVDIVCFSLKSLRISLRSAGRTERVRIYIDAPNLTILHLRDCYSLYYFVRCPSTLVSACIDLRKYDDEDEDEDEELVGGECGEVKYLQHMSKFVRGMSFLGNLNLQIENHTNFLAYLYAADDGFSPIFCNLTRFEITLYHIGLSGWKDLLLSLQCFPNLTHLKVKMEGLSLVEQNDRWCTPSFVPDCLVCSLKNIHILRFDKSEELLKLLEYILSNANLLERLRLEQLRVESSDSESEHAYIVWKQCQFCGSLFKLPRSSPTCEIVFSGAYVTASSNTFKEQCLTCQVYLDDRYPFASSCSPKPDI